MAKTGPAALTDARLVQGFLQGREEWFDELYRRYEDELFALALHITGDPDDARDVVLVTMAEVRDFLPGWEPGRASLRTCVHNICERRALNRKRDNRRARNRLCCLDEVPEWRLPSCAGPAEEHERNRGAALVRAAIAGLPPGEREAVRLRWLEEMSNREVAEALGRSPVAVRHALRRALARLRPALAALGGSRAERRTERCVTDGEREDEASGRRVPSPRGRAHRPLRGNGSRRDRAVGGGVPAAGAASHAAAAGNPAGDRGAELC